ncbi:putative NADH dehydrogenase/NAD(P)H nitroreductase [Mangrovihabitans endophyticus]|uniref:Putative NADH dehydrogenase/NAD(P)H nitroreductase n=1 Tax=Mangrovihabitans endophyticus TaxID=1751298 RepID=A0A8J3C3Q3_9ACTN|nr:putative NADH dehydrogenase/NAD(P)H nitroreductase [Mangrovihabitans endophyticus]
MGRLDDAGRTLLFSGARTVNAFASTPVSDTELAEIWDLAKWPPTAANSQPLRVLYLRTSEAKDRVVPLMNEGNRDKTASAPVVAVLAADTSFHEHMPTLFPIKPELRDVFDANPAMREGSAKFSASLQIGYFLLAVRANGLAAGPMAGFDAAAVDKEFFPGGRFTSLLVVNIGHPGENASYPRGPRLPHETAVQFL